MSFGPQSIPAAIYDLAPEPLREASDALARREDDLRAAKLAQREASAAVKSAKSADQTAAAVALEAGKPTPKETVSAAEAVYERARRKFAAAKRAAAEEGRRFTRVLLDHREVFMEALATSVETDAARGEKLLDEVLELVAKHGAAKSALATLRRAGGRDSTDPQLGEPRGLATGTLDAAAHLRSVLHVPAEPAPRPRRGAARVRSAIIREKSAATLAKRRQR